MDNKRFITNLNVKTEPNASTTKKVFPSNSPFTQLANKSVSHTRLASFKPPRDLLLTGSTTSSTNSSFSFSSGIKGTRKTYMPNFNVTRRKGNSETSSNDLNNDLSQKYKSKEKDKDKKPLPNKKKNANIVQTRGVFSEGLAPGKVKAFSNAFSEKAYNEAQVMSKPKLNLNKTVLKSEEENKLKSVLRDDFIDDRTVLPDINFTPSSLPLMYSVKKPEAADNLEKTFETLQVKTEKKSSADIDDLKNDILYTQSLFESGKDPKLFLFEFPSLIQSKEEPFEKKKASKKQPDETEKQNESSDGLSTLGEGLLGYLRLHENGKAYLVMEKAVIPLCVTRHNTRQELMSTSINVEASKGEVISLGTIDATFTCSANFFQDVS